MSTKYFFFSTCFLFSFFMLSCKKDELDLSKGFIKYFGGMQFEDASDVQQASDGGYIIIGSTASFGSGGMDMYVVKTDSKGNEEWHKTFGGSLDDMGSSVLTTSDGGYIFLGTYRYTSGPDSSKTDMYVVKVNSNGDTLWTKKYGNFTGFSTNEEGISINHTSDGGYIIAGNTDVGTDGDMVVLKIDVNGILINFGQHPSADAAGLDQVVNILQRQNGEYVLSSYSVGLNSPRTIIISTNLATAPNSIDNNDLFELSMQTTGEVALTNDGEYILTGQTDNGDIFLVKFKDAISNPKTWFKTYGGAGVDVGSSVQPGTDGGYIVLGSTTSSGAGSSDIYLFKVDASGDNVAWTKTFGGTGLDEGKVVRRTSDGGYIILGMVEFGDDPSNSDNIICLIKVNDKGEIKN